MSNEPATGRSARQRNAAGGAAAGSIVLGPNDSLHGSLRTDSGVTVLGSVEGEIFAGGDVVVEASATVIASIEARNIDIRGTVKGNVTSARRLSLGGSGTLQGDASAARLVVEGGATLNGSISMSGAKDVDLSEDLAHADFEGETEVNGELVAVSDHTD
jgi:cytoskeletal protein CcmA (bactofilin family)